MLIHRTVPLSLVVQLLQLEMPPTYVCYRYDVSRNSFTHDLRKKRVISSLIFHLMTVELRNANHAGRSYLSLCAHTRNLQFVELRVSLRFLEYDICVV